MDIFRQAKVVRLRSNEGTYVVAGEDGESVRLQQNGSSRRAKWTVECTILGIHLRSCYGRYLAASNDAGRVVQKPSVWRWLDPSVQWKPIGRLGRTCVMLRTRDDKFLSAHPSGGGVTHSSLSRSTLDLKLWDVDRVESNRGPTHEKLQVNALIVIGLVFIWFAHEILGLFSFISNIVSVIFGLVGNILFALSRLVTGTWTAILFFGGAFGFLFQLLDVYDKINSLLHRYPLAGSLRGR